MKTCRNFYGDDSLMEKRLVFIGIPEGGNQPPRPEAAKEHGGEAEKPDPLADRAKRDEVYREAEQKAQELIHSEDPRKQKVGQDMMQQVAAAKDREPRIDATTGRYELRDESQAITEAYGLRDRLDSIARRDERIAARERKAAPRQTVQLPDQMIVSKLPKPRKAPPAKAGSTEAMQAALDEADAAAEANTRRMAAETARPAFEGVIRPGSMEATQAALDAAQGGQSAAKPAEAAPSAPVVAAEQPAKPAEPAPTAAAEKPPKPVSREARLAAELDAAGAEATAKLAAAPSAGKAFEGVLRDKPTALPVEETPAEPAPVAPVAAAELPPVAPPAKPAEPAPSESVAAAELPPVAPPAAPPSKPGKIPGLAGLAGLGSVPGPRVEGGETPVKGPQEVHDLKRLPAEIQAAYDKFVKSKGETGVVETADSRYTFQRTVVEHGSGEQTVRTSKVRVYKESIA